MWPRLPPGAASFGACGTHRGERAMATRKTCHGCRRWKDVKNKMRIAELLGKAAESFAKDKDEAFARQWAFPANEFDPATGRRPGQGEDSEA